MIGLEGKSTIADRKKKYFKLLTTSELNLKRAESLDRLDRVFKAQTDLHELINQKCKDGSDISSSEFKESQDELRDFYGIPDSVYLWELEKEDVKLDIRYFKGLIPKAINGKMSHSDAGTMVFRALECVEFDLWWVLFGEGSGYYDCPSDCEILDHDDYEELVKFATREGGSK